MILDLESGGAARGDGTKRRWAGWPVRAAVLALAVVAVVAAPAYGQGNTDLTVEPLTWNVIGLDSNDVTTGPNRFPVGARVCNTSGASTSNLLAQLVWESDGYDAFTDDGNPHPYINLRAGTNFQISETSLADGVCIDVYFEVEVTRDAGAYESTRGYHIQATADGLDAATSPQPRELFVEYLISQARNSVTDLQLDGVSIPDGGTMALAVGETYEITLVGSTATNGYNQIETFVNFPNTIFRVLSVETTYTAETSGNMAPPYDRMYGDACVWENDPNSPNYLACNDSGKAGGAISVTYQVEILEMPAAPLVNPEPLSTLIYDFSGSSFHYNADFGVSTRYAAVVDPPTLSIAKSLSPDPVNVNGVSALTFTISNPNPAAVSDISFGDTFPTSPGAMVVADPPNATTSGCGSPTFAPSANDTSLSFSDGTVAANGTCTVTVNVTADAIGSYTNISDNLVVGTVDTGDDATAGLTVIDGPTPPACTPGLELARWTMDPSQGTTAPPAPSFVSSLASSATASYTALAPGGHFIDSVDNGNPLNSWIGSGEWSLPPGTAPTSTDAPYFQFDLDTSGFTDVQISFDTFLQQQGDWANPGNNFVYVFSDDGSGWSGAEPDLANTGITKNAWVSVGPFTATTTGSSTTSFRITYAGRNKSGAEAVLDNIVFTGCGVAAPPALSKAFSPDPVAVGGTSTLTFTLENENNVQLTGVTFTDDLPSGVQVASPANASTTCGGSPTWAPSAGDTSLTFGDPTGATIPPRVGSVNGTCTAQVDVVVTSAGPHTNVSGVVSSAESGPNDGPDGIATDTITAVVPPTISKLFSPNPILEGGVSTLTFTVTNPNQNSSLSGIAFADTYPTGVLNTSPLSTSDGCGGAIMATAGGSSISYSGGSLAGGASCTVSIDVTAASAGTYPNASGNVSHIINGVTETGDTAEDTLTVNAPNPGVAIRKQVGPTGSGAWSAFLARASNDDVYYQIVVENTGDVELNPLTVSDPDLDLNGCTWTSPLPVADAADDDHITTCVIGPVSAVSGETPNTATTSGTHPSGTVEDTSTAIYATTGLTLVKTVAESGFENIGDELNYSYEVTNSGSAPLRGPVTVTDDKVTVSCPAVSTVVPDGDDFLDPGESIVCTATYTVVAGDLNGTVTNTATATVDGVDSNEDSVSVGWVPVELLGFTIQ